jgi:hypothetical protein
MCSRGVAGGGGEGYWCGILCCTVQEARGAGGAVWLWLDISARQRRRLVGDGEGHAWDHHVCEILRDLHSIYIVLHCSTL